MIRDPFFQFFIDGSTYEIPYPLAISSSNYIKKKFQINKYYSRYDFEIVRDPHFYFSKFIDLLYGQDIIMNEENAFFYGYLGDVLEIPLLSECADEFRTVSITKSNIFDILTILSKYNIKYQRIIEFAAKHWDSLLCMNDEYEKLSMPILKYILSEGNLTVSFDFVDNLIKKIGTDYIELFQFCDFTTLTSEEILKFVDYISLDYIKVPFLKRIVPRLLMEMNEMNNSIQEKDANTYYFGTSETTTPSTAVKSNENNQISRQTDKQDKPTKIDSPKTKKEVHTNDIRELPTQSQRYSRILYTDDQFDGVISLFKRSMPNWHEYVRVIAPGVKQTKKYAIFDYEYDSYWNNYNGSRCEMKDAWIIIGFPHHTLRLTSYTIEDKARRQDTYQLKSWVIYGSLEDRNFDEIVTQVENCTEMNKPYPLATFHVNPRDIKPYSYFKIRMLSNHSKWPEYASEFSIMNLELFGVLSLKQ